MAYDDDLADWIRALLGPERGITEQRMFGGLAFLVAGNMAVAASGKGGLMVRVDRAEADQLLETEGVEPMVMAGRVTRGWLRVTADAVRTDEQLGAWVRRGVDHARTLPAKEKSPAPPRRIRGSSS